MDRRVFFDRIRPLFGGRLRQPQVEGMDAILNSWERRGRDQDPRWLAYMFATAFHETNRTMQPVREAYWLSENWRRRNLRYYPYYGRGYVQLTWRDNYARAGNFVGADLVRNPDLAMDPGHSATIMHVGMTEGWFRADSRGRQTLKRYFDRSVDDPVGAREIINGREIKNGRLLARTIAEYHRAFLQAIVAATRAVTEARPEFLESVFADEMTLESVGGASGLAAPADYAPEEAFDLPDAEAFGQAIADEDEGFAMPGPDERFLIRQTTKIVIAYLDGRDLPAAELPQVITSVHDALASLSGRMPGFDHGFGEAGMPADDDTGFEEARGNDSGDCASPIPAARARGRSRAATTRTP